MGALWIDRGLLQQDGPVAEVYAAYQRFIQFKRMNGWLRPWCERSFDLVRPIRSYDPAIAALGEYPPSDLNPEEAITADRCRGSRAR